VHKKIKDFLCELLSKTKRVTAVTHWTQINHFLDIAIPLRKINYYRNNPNLIPQGDTLLS
jgi:hypothetical protein